MPTLNWIGKDAVVDHHKQVPFRLLKPYPDFVCELVDGCFLVVEYKGFDRWSDDDSKEKRAVGQIWEEKSHGQCLFVMPKGPDWNAILAKFESAFKNN